MKTFCAGLALALTGGSLAAAAPAAPPALQGARTPIVLVAGGCGLGYHRGPYGGCRPNGLVVLGPRVVAPVRLPPPCPRGYFRDPDPARPICYPRF